MIDPVPVLAVALAYSLRRLLGTIPKQNNSGGGGMTRRLNNGTMELLDKGGTVVGTRKASDKEIRQWSNFTGTKPATDDDIRQWGNFIWDSMTAVKSPGGSTTRATTEATGTNE